MSRKTVYVCVCRNPKATDEERLETLKIAEEDYLKARGITREDVDFVLDYYSGSNAYEDENPYLVDLSDTIRAIASCDEVIVGENWQKTWLARTVFSICVTYKIPVVCVNHKTFKEHPKPNVTVYIKDVYDKEFKYK